MGLAFTERMVGYVSSSITGDYADAARQGRREGAQFDAVLTIATDDLEGMLEKPDHPARIYGSVRADWLSADPLSVRGHFNLFAEDKEAVHTDRMRYRMRLRATDGRSFYVDAFKVVRDASLLQLWPATTTLYVNLYDGHDETGTLRAQGTLHIRPADFARQLSTLNVTNALSNEQRVQAVARFGCLFAGRLWEHFGGVATRGPIAGDRAVIREKRPLRAPAPEVHFFGTADGVELRLVRYRGGSKGPFICAPGFSNTSQVFAWDGLSTNWVEYFVEAGYDLWLLDYRASPDLPASRKQFTLDDIARFDWPAAVDHVRRVTGADSVQILGHCIGSATAFMSLLSGSLSGVRQFIASQVMPFVEVSVQTRLKAGVHLDRILGALGVSEVDTKAGTDTSGRIIDELLRLYPMPAEWQSLGPVCRRIYAIYGPVLKPDQLNRDTRDALSWIFGHGNLTAFAQIRQFIRHGRLVDAAGRDVYLPHAERLTPSIVLMQGADNALFLPKGSQDTLQWISNHLGPGSVTRLVFPRYAHLDCFIGKDAVHDVYPAVLEELEKLS